jgi:hypothetical protein
MRIDTLSQEEFGCACSCDGVSSEQTCEKTSGHEEVSPLSYIICQCVLYYWYTSTHVCGWLGSKINDPLDLEQQ